MSAHSVSALSSLVQSVKDPDSRVRDEVAFAISEIIPSLEHAELLEQITLSLVQALQKEQDRFVRRNMDAAICSSASRLTDDAALSSALQSLLNHALPDVRRAAARAMGNLGGLSEFAVVALGAALSDKNHKVRREAISTLLIAGGASRSVLPKIIESLRDSDSEVRKDAAALVGLLGPEAVCARSALTDALNDPEVFVRFRAAQALAQVCHQDPSPIGALADILQTAANPELRRLAATSLGRIGRRARSAIKVLREALKDDRKEVREAAAGSLAAIA
jgi:HEAT repeat protein